MILQGFLLGISLIMAIGPQNAFVIKQGIAKNFIFLTVLTVSVCDILLIALGVLGVGQFFNKIYILKLLLTLAGISFLFLYATKTFLNAFKKQRLMLDKSSSSPQTALKVILVAMSFSLLNPHAILDTVVIIGSISAQYDFNNALLFALGTSLASIVWFSLLSYASKVMAKHLQKPTTWMVLDVVIAIICYYSAIKLAIDLF